ncbi:MAG: hypothetical protein ACE5OS_09290 [Anaerolineae bacterium]
MMAMDATQTMELTQMTQMIKWLEGERRKDKATIAALQEKAQGQEQQLAQQAAQIQDLQTTLGGIQGLISQAADFEQTVANYKNEIIFLLDQREDAWKKERAEAERLRKIEMKSLADQLGQLDKEAQVLRRHDEDMKARQAEEKRLNQALQSLTEQVADLSKRSDDRMQAVTYLEEQRRADNRRIAELEQGTTELRKKTESQATKSLLLEETIHKQRARIEEAIKQLKDFEKTIEEVRVAEFRREQEVKKYREQAEEVRQEMENWRAQTQRFIEQYQLNKRALEKLENFRARQEKRQNEVAEMQRLAEDRLKRQWEEWQAERDKELKKRQLVLDEQWRSQERKNQEHSDWLERLKGRADAQQTYIEALLEARRADAHHTLGRAQEVLEQTEQMLAEGQSVMRGEQ